MASLVVVPIALVALGGDLMRAVEVFSRNEEAMICQLKGSCGN